MSRSDVKKQDLIIRWYRRSQKRRTKSFTIFDQFIALWVAFNSWSTFVSKEATDRKMINSIRTNRALTETFALLMNEDDFRNDVLRLADFGVFDMRPGHEGRLTRINDLNLTNS
jgi:hypothetical protein